MAVTADAGSEPTRLAGLLASGAARWRNPPSGEVVAPGLSVYHDASGGEFALVVGQGALLRATIYQFPGSYLSVAVGTMAAERDRLGPGQHLSATLEIETTRPLTAFLRLNLQDAVRVEPLFDTIVVHQGVRRARFAMDAARVSFSELRDAWLDVIFSEPEMTEIVVRGVDMSVVPND